MNHRYRLASQPPFPCRRASLTLLVTVVLTLAFGSPVLAQRLPSLRPEIKTAADAKPFAEEIRNFVKSQVEALENDKDPNNQQRAREALVKESGGAGVAPSPSYLDVYATVINEQFLPLADAKVPVRTRLNAAIALQRIARNANSAKLAPVATKFINDPCVAVTLWAVKSSQSILPASAATGKPDKLSAAVVDAAKKYADNGDLIDEAYLALTLNQKFELVNDQTAAAITGDLLKLFQSRIEQYVTTTPPRPDLERRGVNFLTLARLWDTKEGDKQRAVIRQQISNLIGLVAQHAAARPESDRKEFVVTLKNLGASLQAISKHRAIREPKLETIGKSLEELQPSMSEQEFTDRAAAAYDTIKAKFPDTKPPPKMSDTAVREPEAEIVVEDPDADKAEPVPEPRAGGDGAKDGGAAAPAPAPAPAPAEKAVDRPALQPRDAAR